MTLLLDTHILIWLLGPGVTSDIEQAIRRADRILASAVNIWEIAIKAGQGRISADAREISEHLATIGIAVIPIEADHAAAVQFLPDIHRDPFDRLLIAQALNEGLTILTADETIPQYPEISVEKVARP